ncbi:hypothetical protein IJ182_05185 [bacterium]|nr:hypothetical protein [bacterium]
MNTMFFPSFGKKIPITQCCIKDINHNRFVPATFFEVDCTDMKDINEIYQTKGDWSFKNLIAAKMFDKNNCIDNGFYFYDNKAFYIMQKQDGEIVGVSEVEKIGKQINLDFIESEPEGQYKYVGQSMIASLGQVLRNEKRKKIYIPNPVKTAQDFYTQKCGFKKIDDSSALVMKLSQAGKLSKKLEKETKHKMLEVQV